MPALTPARRSELRAKAHALSPAVMIGDKGLTETVVAEIDRALKAHELIKVKAATNDREARVAWMAQICERLQAQAVQVIGKILVVWRESEEKPSPPEAKQARPAAKKPTRIARPRSPAPSPPRESGPRRRRPRTSR